MPLSLEPLKEVNIIKCEKYFNGKYCVVNYFPSLGKFCKTRQ